jgi:hypothetical protein
MAFLPESRNIKREINIPSDCMPNAARSDQIDRLDDQARLRFAGNALGVTMQEIYKQPWFDSITSG